MRVFHWALALAVLGSWLTHELDAFTWHVWCGYCVLVLTASRIVWGFVGPRHARFASFVRSPMVIARHARSLFGPAGAAHYPGHNPLGAVMVLAFLVLLLLQAGAGLFANDDIANTGPLYGYVSDATSDTLAQGMQRNRAWQRRGSDEHAANAVDGHDGGGARARIPSLCGGGS